MYAELLDAALSERLRSGPPGATGERLAELLRCRSKLTTSTPSTSRVAVAVADQLAYDISLIGLAQGVGVDCDPLRFDQPELERHRLEQALVSRRVPLNDLDEQSSSTDRTA
jgi:hypothetical protein